MKQSIEYMNALNDALPDLSDEQLVRDVAFVFLGPKEIFKLLLDSLAWKWKIRNAK